MDTPSLFFDGCIDYHVVEGSASSSHDQTAEISTIQPQGQQPSLKHSGAFVNMPLTAQDYLPLPLPTAWNPHDMNVFGATNYYEDPLHPKVEDEDRVSPLRTSTSSATPGSKGSTRTASATSTHLSMSSLSTELPLEELETETPKKKRSKKDKKAAAVAEEAKRDKFLERNRVAASKCRQKKKEWVSDLQETKFDLESQNSQLQMEYNGLVGEVSRMKNELMTHAICNDRNIDQWLENEARRFVQKNAEGSDRRHSSSRADDRSYRTSSGYRHSFDGGQTSELIPTPADGLFAQTNSPCSGSGADVDHNHDHMPNDMFDLGSHQMRIG